jgi:hypothetical protein
MQNQLRRLAIVAAKLPAIDQSLHPAVNFLLAMVEQGRPTFSSPASDEHDLLSPKVFQRAGIAVTPGGNLAITRSARRSATSRRRCRKCKA